MAQMRLERYEVEHERLPDVCMRCGASATVYRDKNFSWYPPWITVTVLIAVPVAVILALVLTKRMRVSAPLCDKHRHHWLSRTLFIWLSLLALGVVEIGGLILLAVLSDRPGQAHDSPLPAIICGGGVVLLLAWLITIAIVQSTAIRPTEITDDSITLTGLSPVFVEAVREQDERDEDERRSRRRVRRPRDEEDDYDPQPRRRRPPPEAYRESEE